MRLFCSRESMKSREAEENAGDLQESLQQGRLLIPCKSTCTAAAGPLRTLRKKRRSNETNNFLQNHFVGSLWEWLISDHPKYFSIFIFFSENSQNFHCCVVYLFYARPWVHWKGKVLSINNQTHRCTIFPSNVKLFKGKSHRVVVFQSKPESAAAESKAQLQSCPQPVRRAIGIDCHFFDFFTIACYLTQRGPVS